MLSERLKSGFESRVRARGEEYVGEAVDDLRVDPSFVQARVHGTDVYRVSLEHDSDEEELVASCSCPHVMGTGLPCKHIWALLRTCDIENELPEATNALRLRLRVEFDPRDDGDDEAPESRRDDEPSWEAALASLRDERTVARFAGDNPWVTGRDRAVFLLLPDETLASEENKRSGHLAIAMRAQRLSSKRTWGPLKKPTDLSPDMVSSIRDSADRELIEVLFGARETTGGALGLAPYYDATPDAFTLPGAMQRSWVRRAAEAGKLFLGSEGRGGKWTQEARLAWSGDRAWTLCLVAGESDEDDEHFEIDAVLRHPDHEERPLAEATLVTEHVVVVGNKVAPFDPGSAYAWVAVLRRHGALRVPKSEQNKLVEAIATSPAPPEAEIDESLRVERMSVDPMPQLHVQPTPATGSRRGRELRVVFDYEGVEVTPNTPEARLFSADRRVVIERDLEAESAALDELMELGASRRPSSFGAEEEYELLDSMQLADLVVGLTRIGWRVWGDDKEYRSGGSLELSMSSSSSIDWFDVRGEATFDGATVELPALLAAIRNGRTMVLLSDGSTGIVPDEWLTRYAPLAHFGEVDEQGVRFRPVQIGLIDALLEALPEISHDEAVEHARQRLASFDGIKSHKAPTTMLGELRTYQEDGLGWLHFLRELGFGGCLADDMGLGKTVQVLALLEGRRLLRAEAEKAGEDAERIGPALVVAPKSLIYNWIEEAGRFTPAMTVLDHTGVDRFKRHGLVKSSCTGAMLSESLGEFDLILTTYGTLRQDIELLAGVRFDYAVLDESQAIKNSKSLAAKASRVLVADHRLALTGTPIENHIGELLSQFDFLNPGFSAWTDRANKAGFTLAAEDGKPQEPLSPTALIARAVRPFVLRRTKEEVLDDLPAKTEQTLWCDLLPKDRKAYDEVRAHYRQSLLGQIDDVGLARSKMHVLEALLRLRQAACHRGLVDPTQADEPSAKLDLLVDQIAQVTAEGHKALVFSQFTSLLALVKRRLDATSTPYESLDGKTRNRAERINRFQNDPDCRLFLISLKAGGVGLNLTAAQYVYLLDPWWNPAVEAQAIDRAHRIGQTQPVNAYRIIARDTVEEKVLELQASKRELADAVIRADGGMLRDLTRDDLEHLLS